MRWLVAHPGPNFSVADVHNGWMEALADAGEQVQAFNLHDRLNFYDAAMLDTGVKDEDGNLQVIKALNHEEAIGLASSGIMSACYQYWPDVVLVVSASFVPPQLVEIMRKRGHKVILLHTESPYQDTEQLTRAAHANMNLLNDPVNITEYQRLGIPAYYMPHAYRPRLHSPGPPDPRLLCDLAFSGTGFESRIEFFEAMLPHLGGAELLLAGNWIPLRDKYPDSPLNDLLAHEVERCLDNEQTVDMYRSAHLGINLYRRESEDEHKGEGWAIGPREVEMAATGLFFLRDPRPEGDALFPMLPTFATPEDAAEQALWWLKNEDQRREAAAKARSAIRDRTFTNNLHQLMAWMDAL